MSGRHGVYRSLQWLYPTRFRLSYGADLSQAFDDLAADRGHAAAWRRTALDLIITVPRYRLESVMTPSQSNTTLTLGLVALVAGGVLSVLIGLYPGIVLIGVAVVLGITQRTRLARSIRTPDTNRRRRRLVTAGALAGVSVLSIATYSYDLSDDKISTASLLLLSSIGSAAMIGTLVYLLIGLLTPKTGHRSPGVANAG